MSNEVVDVIIVGAVVAWSLADTKIHIVYLEQGPMRIRL